MSKYLQASPFRFLFAVCLFGALQPSFSQTLLTDNYTVSSNSNDPNFEIDNGRQGGTSASSYYAFITGSNAQVGNTVTDVGQPGGASEGNYLLLSGTAIRLNELAIGSSLGDVPLTITMDIYTGTNTANTNWMAFSLTGIGTNNTASPNTGGAGSFGFLVRGDRGVEIFSSNAKIFEQNTPGFAAGGDSWTITFSDPSGNGSAFMGNGSHVTIYNGDQLIFDETLASDLSMDDLGIGFRAISGMTGGIDNLSVVAVPEPLTGAYVAVGLGLGLLVALRRRFRRV